MSAQSSFVLVRCVTFLLLGGAWGCVDTDPAPPLESAGTSSTGGGTSTDGLMPAGGTGQVTGAGATSAAPAPGAIYKCEDPVAPKTTAASDNPAVVNFEMGAFGAASATGEPSVDFMFTGAGNGGTYTYQEPGASIMRDVSLVEGRNGGQALGVHFTNAVDYGGGVGVYFYPCVDASAYAGITLWARGSLPARTGIAAGTVTVSLDVGNVATNSLDSIACAANVPSDATLCTRPSTAFVVSDTWTEHTFVWGDFAAGNKNGTPYRPNGDNLLGINLAMDNAFGMPNDLELVIDDVAFVR